MLIPLQTLIDTMKEDSDSLMQILSSFSCAKDHDIENFLHNRAVEFEALSKARTYLLCDENEMIENGRIVLLGYISLAPKSLQIPEGLSIRRRKELDGFSGKIHNEPITEIPCYLIGQLARNDSVPRESLSGRDLIEEAQRIIMGAVQAVGGRYMMIECHNDPKLLAFYETNGFSEIARVADSGMPMVQMLCKLVD